METRKEQKEKRRQEILLAGLDLFVAKGYAATKITDIAKRANMSTGLLFHYFESKEKLYEELVTRGLRGTVYASAIKYDYAIQYFEVFTEQLFTYMRQQPGMTKLFVLMTQTQRLDSTPPHIREIAMQVDTIEKFVPIVEWGQQEGSIRQGNPRALCNAFWWSLQGVAEQYAMHPEMDLPDPQWLVDIVRKRAE